MQPIHDLLNKIRWDKQENPDDYKIFYLDRIENKLKQLDFKDIKEITDNFITVRHEDETIELPLHRIKKVTKNGKAVWLR